MLARRLSIPGARIGLVALSVLLAPFAAHADPSPAALALLGRTTFARAYGRFGETLFDDMQYREARDAFRKAVALDPRGARARERLLACEAILGDAPPIPRRPREIACVTRPTEALARDLETALDASDEHLGAGRVVEALEACKRAREVVRWSPFKLPSELKDRLAENERALVAVLRVSAAIRIDPGDLRVSILPTATAVTLTPGADLEVSIRVENRSGRRLVLLPSPPELLVRYPPEGRALVDFESPSPLGGAEPLERARILEPGGAFVIRRSEPRDLVLLAAGGASVVEVEIGLLLMNDWLVARGNELYYRDAFVSGWTRSMRDLDVVRERRIVRLEAPPPR